MIAGHPTGVTPPKAGTMIYGRKSSRSASSGTVNTSPHLEPTPNNANTKISYNLEGDVVDRSRPGLDDSLFASTVEAPDVADKNPDMPMPSRHSQGSKAGDELPTGDHQHRLSGSEDVSKDGPNNNRVSPAAIIIRSNGVVEGSSPNLHSKLQEKTSVSHPNTPDLPGSPGVLDEIKQDAFKRAQQSATSGKDGEGWENFEKRLIANGFSSDEIQAILANSSDLAKDSGKTLATTTGGPTMQQSSIGTGATGSTQEQRSEPQTSLIVSALLGWPE